MGNKQKIFTFIQPKSKMSAENITSIFTYGTLRKDFVDLLCRGTMKGDRWGVTNKAQSKTAYIKGYKLLQNKNLNFPFVIKNDSQENSESEGLVFGTLLTWSDRDFN